MKTMTKKQAEQIFKNEILPVLNKHDVTLVREAWHEFTDYLCKDGQITDKQYNNWLTPKFIK